MLCWPGKAPDEVDQPKPSPCRSRRIRTTIGLFRADKQGSIAIEFAIVSLPFFGLLFAIFQTCFAFLMQQGLKAAVDSAARQVMTGTAQSTSSITTWQNFRDQLVCPPAGSSITNLLPSFITCTNILVDVRPYTSFTSISGSNINKSFLTDGSGEQYSPGTGCQIVIVRAAYPMPVFLPVLSWTGLMSNIQQNTSGLMTYNGSLVQMISTVSVFRNEPFLSSTSQSTGGC